MKSFSKTTDELLLSATVKDVNDFFEQEKNFLIEYHSHLKDATAKADRMTKRHKGLLLGFLSINCYYTLELPFMQVYQFK